MSQHTLPLHRSELLICQHLRISHSPSCLQSVAIVLPLQQLKLIYKDLNWRNTTLVPYFAQLAPPRARGPIIPSIALQTNEKYCSEGDSGEYEYDVECSNEAWLFDHIKACISQIEEEIDFEDGILQKCITMLSHETVPDHEEPRYIIRIYSPTAPMYIDVNFQYYCPSHWSEVKWFYSLGYKIQRLVAL
ncbi:hypothetical protein BD769DRAFT_998531 [Suillus cothurnatus]|nr:hypothetical protein BD769DRAFT_998531 [Suillus cothurnatus]